MRNLKRVLSLALALVMVLGMMVIGTSAATFTDDAEITNKEAVEVLYALGIVKGMGNDEFDPTGTFTREQAAKMIAYMKLGADKAEKLVGTAVFDDVAANRWSAKYINYCASLDIIAGVGDNKFDPEGKLTDVALGKMILVALGYDATKYVGDNWATSTAIDMIDAKLVDVVTGTNISREDASAMILTAMKKGTDIVTYDVKVGTEVVKFDNQNDAVLYKAVVTGSEYLGKVTVTTDSLLEEVYGVSCTATPDAFGRPATTYACEDWVAPMVFTKTPVATFNTAMTEKELFAALGANGIQGASDKYIVMDTIYINGAVQGTAVDAGNGQYDKSATGDARETVIVAKNDRSNLAGFGEGVTVEIFKTTKSNHFVMVAYNEYVGTIASVTKADEKTGTDRYVTITGVGTYETEDFAARDVVLYTVNSRGIASMKAPTTIAGQVTKITSDGVYTIGGVEYKLSQNAVDTPVLSSIGSWYVDSCGNIIKAKDAASTKWSYGVLTNYAAQDKSTADLLGAGAKEAAEKFELINASGDKVVLDGAFTTKANGTVDTWVYTGTTASDVNALVRYALNADGKVTVIETVATSGTVTGEAAASALTATKGTAILNSDYVTDKTLFIAYQPKAGAVPAKFAVYTGYNNIPATLAGSAYEYFYATKPNGDIDNTTIAAVVLTVASVDVQSAPTFVWFASADKYSETTATGTVYTYTNVYLNGVKGEIKFLNTDPTAKAVAGHLYQYTTNKTTGFATLGDNYGILSAASATTATVGKIESGYYVTDHSTTKVIYVDADTVYFQVDPITKAVTQVEGMPAVDPAYDIEQIMATNSSPNAFSAQDPATIVYFAVIAK